MLENMVLNQPELQAIIVRHFPDAYFTLDREGKLTSMNQVGEAVIGFRLEELIGRTFGQLVHEEDVKQATRFFQLALQGEAHYYDIRVCHKNGDTVHLHLSLFPIKAHNEEVTGVCGFAKDVTNLARKEAELLQTTNSLNLAQEVSRIGSWDYDTEKNTVYCSESLRAILGLSESESAALDYFQLLRMVVPEDRDCVDDQLNRLITTGETMEMDYRVNIPDGSEIHVHTKAVAISKHASGRTTRIIGVLTDETERVMTEQRLKTLEERLHTITEHIDVGLWSMDLRTNKVVFASLAVHKLTGYPMEKFFAEAGFWSSLIHDADKPAYLQAQQHLLRGESIHHQYRIVRADGEIRWIEDKTFPVRDSNGEIIRLDGLVQDVSKRKQAEEEIRFFAYHDYLTKLPNRRSFDNEVEQFITERKHTHFALFYLDIDRFKLINDTIGHEIGDALLCQVSERITSAAGDHGVFRVGGDEFAVLLAQNDQFDAYIFGEKLVNAVNDMYIIEGYELCCTASVGVSVFPDDGKTMKELKMNADTALYRAKELGRNHVQMFNKSFSRENDMRIKLENDLRKALRNQELVVHYQPKVKTQSGHVAGAEALIRWRHAELGMISPAAFIPLAEESGLIHEISSWVIEQVCAQLKQWRCQGLSVVPVSINLSAKCLMKSDLAHTFERNLRDNAIEPELIEVEITEDSLILADGAAVPMISTLKEMGIKIALDDFGTGYSAIGYLKKFNMDYIKIDRSFIKDIHTQREDYTIVQSVILLANGFQLKVVAEGVETEEQWKLLRSLNCHYIQGYLFGKPMPAGEFADLIRPVDEGRGMRA